MRAYFHTFEGERVTLESHAELEQFLELDAKAAKKAAAAQRKKHKAEHGESAPTS